MNRLHFDFPCVLICLTVALCSLASPTLAAGNPPKPPSDWNIEQGIRLPIEKTPWEKAHEHLFPIIYPTDDPPPHPTVNPAEWEPMSGVLITYPLSIPVALVAEMSQNAGVTSIVSSQEMIANAISYYTANGVNVANCYWLIAPTNSCYTRDYGPWYIFTGDDEQGIVDNIYNRPTRPYDNRIPMILGDSLGIPVYELPLVHTGGNYMSDGMGVGMSTTLVLGENTQTLERIDAIMQDYLGLDVYHKFEDPDPMNLQHIDCWAKLLDPGKILIKRLHPPDQLLEDLAEYISTLMSSYGGAYEVIRIDCDASSPYVNSLILNNKVLVPISDSPLDRQALQTYQDAMPGYEVIGFTGGWASHDALHCRTMGITDCYMLRIVHVPLNDRENNGEDYPLEALVHRYSDQSFLTGSPEVLWKTEGGSYTSIPMTASSGDTFFAYIPEQPDGADIYYYIHAQDESGRSEYHPYVGGDDPHHFYAGPDTTCPTVELATEPPSLIVPENFPMTLTAKVQDNLWIASVTLECLINGVPQDTIDMTLQPLSAVCYDGVMTGVVQPGDRIRFRVKAVDTSVNQNVSYDPPVGYYAMEVAGGARACVWNACGQASGTVFHDLLQRAGIQAVYTVEQPGNFNNFESMYIFLGVYPANYTIGSSQEDAIVAYVNSGHDALVEGGDCWFYDPYNEQLCATFGIIPLADGGPIQGPILGVNGTFTEGMSFTYGGTNQFVDEIAAATGAELIFQQDSTGCGVAYDAGAYRTVGTCFEFSGLQGNNLQSSQEILFQQIINYFFPEAIASSSSGLSNTVKFLPNHFALYQNFPNPFNPRTTIRFDLPQAAHVRLEVFDVAGRVVGAGFKSALPLVDGWREAGSHDVTFDGSDLASGLYFYRIEAGDFTSVKKMVLMK